MTGSDVKYIVLGEINYSTVKIPYLEDILNLNLRRNDYYVISAFLASEVRYHVLYLFARGTRLEVISFKREREVICVGSDQF